MTGVCVFVRNFDAELAEEARAGSADGPRMFSEADMANAAAAARAEGHAAGRAEGHAAGLAEARGETAAATRACLDALAPQIAGFVTAQQEHHAALESQLVDYVAAVAALVLPEFVSRHGPVRARDEVVALAGRILSRARLHLRVPAPLAPEVRGALERLLDAQTERCALQVVPDPTLGAGEARLHWDNGFSHYSYDRLCREILAELHRCQKRQRAPEPRDPAGARYSEISPARSEPDE